MAAYQREVQELMHAPTTEGFVDPHQADVDRNTPDDVLSREVQDDVDSPRFSSDGPSDAELAAGEMDTPSEAGRANNGLPTEDPEQPEQPEQPVSPAPAPAPAPSNLTPPPAADPTEALALQLRQANPTLSLKKALELAESTLAPAPTPEQPSPAPQAPAPTPEIPTTAALEEERKRLDKEWRKGIRDLAPDDELDRMEARLAEIDTLLPKAREAEAQQGQRQHSEYETSAARALALYPDVGTPGSELFKRMEQIHAALEQSNDPIINDPSKPLVIAQMAAKELRVAPRSGPAAPAQSRPAAPPAARPQRSGGPAPMTAPLASASTRPAAPAPNPVEKAIDDIQTPEQYEALLRGMRHTR